MTPDSSLFAPRYWPEWLAVGIARLAARLPYRLQTGVGRGLGRLFQRLNPYRRLVVDINLALCFPELGPREREDLKKHIFESLGISILETLAGLWAANKFFSSAGQIDGLEHLEAAQRQGKGVILLSGHFCSLDFAGRILMQHHPACFTYHELRNPVFDRVVARQRKRNCTALIHRHDTRGFVRALRSGKAVWYAPDQDQGVNNTVFATFFGLQASTLTATARLARLTNAAVLPFIIRRLPDSGGYALTIQPALEDFPGEDDLAYATRFNAMIESQIRANPDQYLWTHRRFKTRPGGESKLYPPKPSRLKRQRRRAAGTLSREKRS